MRKNKFHLASVVEQQRDYLAIRSPRTVAARRNLRSPVANLEKSYRSLAEEQATSADVNRLEEFSEEIAKTRKELAMARAKAREIRLSQM